MKTKNNRHKLFQSYIRDGVVIPQIDLQEALKAVSLTQGVSIKELISNSRKRSISFPRHIFCYLAYHYTTIPLVEVGKMIGNRDHTTIAWGNKNVEDAMSIGYEPLVKMKDEVLNYLKIEVA